MANFNVFYGGLRPQNAGLTMLPSFPPDPQPPLSVDIRAEPAYTAKYRQLAFPASLGAVNCASCGNAACGESQALAAYCAQITGTLAVNDTFDVAIIPAGSVLTRVVWRVASIAAGATFTVSYVASTAVGAAVTAIPTSTINGGAVGMGVFTLATPVAFADNGLLRLVVTALPTSTAANAACRLRGLDLSIAPELLRPQGGAF